MSVFVHNVLSWSTGTSKRTNRNTSTGTSKRSPDQTRAGIWRTNTCTPTLPRGANKRTGTSVKLCIHIIVCVCVCVCVYINTQAQRRTRAQTAEDYQNVTKMATIKGQELVAHAINVYHIPDFWPSRLFSTSLSSTSVIRSSTLPSSFSTSSLSS